MPENRFLFCENVTVKITLYSHGILFIKLYVTAHKDNIVVNIYRQ